MSRVGICVLLWACVVHTLVAVDLEWMAQQADDVFPMAEDENVTEGAGQIMVDFKGKSGKFVIYNKERGQKDKNRVEFEIDELREVNEDGEEVGKKADPKHHWKDFKKTEFKFTTKPDVTVGTAKANVVTLEADFPNLGSMKVETFVIKTAGKVGPNVEDPELPTWDTFAGDVKFNVELKDWKWCGDGATCKDKGQDETGAFIDLDIVVKSKNKPGKGEGKGGKGHKQEEYILGGNIDLDLTDAVFVDGENSSMPDGYPMQTTKGSKDIFTFRFPKFSSEVVYDPVVTSSDSDSNTPSDNHAVSQSVGGLIASLMTFAVSML